MYAALQALSWEEGIRPAVLLYWLPISEAEGENEIRSCPLEVT